jgi:plasmid stabilization system protein ParE
VKRYRVQIAGPARDHVRAISDWWREHRQQNPGLFQEELRQAITLLKAFPLAGPAHPSPVHRDVRRTLLRRTQHYVYYVIDEVGRVVTIVAVWHTARGSEPPL